MPQSIKSQTIGINVSGIFGKMNNVAWTNKGPILPVDLAAQKMYWTFKGEELVVSHVDKFPYLVNFHVPEGVRVVSGAKARLGAHLSPGTTIMPAGYVNFNAGTLGNAMIEGRVSAGVVVGEDSDIGGGASIMGTLSGGGKQVISIGERNLLGANAGLGISLGDDCIVESGLYLTAGTKVKTPDGEVVAARELSGQSGLLFRRNSQSGAVEAIVSDSSTWGGLNTSLHNND